MNDTWLTRGPDDTEARAGALARSLTAPAVLCLRGPLGAGKTTFVRGFVAALGNARVKSPTYALGHSYATTPVVHHLDLYRLGDAHQAWELGLGEMVHDPLAFALIEWADNVPGLCDGAPLVIDVDFESGAHDDERRVCLVTRGPQ